MPFIACCIPSCQKTKYDVTLFQFPRNETLQQIWLKQVASHYPQAKQLTPQQLMKRKICIRHFEQKFLNGKKRLYNACPTLISEEEIATGMPTNPANLEVESDHTYAKSTTTLDHNYCKRPLLNMTSVQASKVPKLQTNEMFCSADQIDALPSTSKETITLAGVKSKRIRLTSSVKCMTPKCHTLYKKCKQIIKSRRLFGGDNRKNIEDATALNKTKTFQKVIEKLSFMQRQFILMQLNTVGVKKQARRYTLEEKLLCLALYKQSPKGYSLLEKIFCLPNKRTLNRILQRIPMNCGINKEFFNALKHKISEWSSLKKLCSILFDEVQLSSGLQFVPSEDVIYGFVPDSNSPKFADHALVVMIRGICGSWRQPIAYYFCEGTMPTVSLVNIIKDVVRAVISTGLEPLAIICDQGMTNQSALKFLQATTRRDQLRNGLTYDGSISIDGNNLCIVYDPPHLLKGIRNNLLNKNMVFQDKLVKWQDIVDIYNYDCQIGNIRMLPKLTDEHVIPDKIKKMKVSNCAKVLSERVAATLRYTGTFSQHADGSLVSSTVRNTADAVEFFDKLFDSCNGSRGGQAPGKLRGPVKPNSPHAVFWTGAINIIKNIKYIDCASGTQKIKSVPTLYNWITTLESHLKLKELLFSKGVSFYYTRNFNQDPLENFFGKIRSHNYRYNNPDTYTFQNSFKSLIMTNMLSIHSNHANCEDDVGATIINLKQLMAPCHPGHTTTIVEEPNILEENATIPTTSSLSAPITMRTVITEKIKCNARGFTAGYIIYKLCKAFKCSKCKKTMITNELTNVHELTLFRERKSLKNKNLKYPCTQFIVAFSELINVVNEYLEINCNKKCIFKNIRQKYLEARDLEWLGCSTHKDTLKEHFIRIITRLQTFNWCRGINLILSGTVQRRITSENLNIVQKLAYNKFMKTRKYRINK